MKYLANVQRVDTRFSFFNHFNKHTILNIQKSYSTHETNKTNETNETKQIHFSFLNNQNVSVDIIVRV